MKYELVLSGKFKKGLKSAKKRGLDILLLDSIVDKLLQGIPLEEKYQDHPLNLIEDDILILTLVDTGTHADLFKK